MDNLEAFVLALPKVELHVHLVGSAPVETVLGLARRHPDRGVPATAQELREFYVFRDFPHFIDVYTAVTGLISEPEDIADLVRGVAASLAAQQVRYAEFQFGPYAFQLAGMPDAVITEALDAGARYALAECGVRIGWIIEFPGQSAGIHARAALRLALRRMADAGLLVTLNSDDPPMFGTSLSNEYLVAGRDLGFSPAGLAGLAANGVRASFLGEPEKAALLAEIAAVPLP